MPQGEGYWEGIFGTSAQRKEKAENHQRTERLLNALDCHQISVKHVGLKSMGSDSEGSTLIFLVVKTVGYEHKSELTC